MSRKATCLPANPKPHSQRLDRLRSIALATLVDVFAAIVEQIRQIRYLKVNGRNKDAAARANHRLPIAGRVPGNAQARREIAVMRNWSRLGIVVIAKPVIDGQTMRGLPRILRIHA